MKVDKPSKTAQYMALFRALETTRRDRLFNDPYAIHFLDFGLRVFAKASKNSIIGNYLTKIIQNRIPGAFSSGIARTKYIDDVLAGAVNDGIKQVIILGAGFDTRSLRLAYLKDIPVIEIDHPSTSSLKTRILKKCQGTLSEDTIYLQIDFNKQSLEQLAEKNNLDYLRATTFIWEGVTNYLTEETVKRTFAFISRFARGSCVIFTYVHKEVLTNPGAFFGAEKLLAELGDLEERWTFGFLPDHLSSYLKNFSLLLIDDLGATEYRNKYLPDRTEKGYEFYRVAFAKING